MEHFLYACANYSSRIWALSGWVLAGCALTLALSRHTGEYISSIILTSLEIVYSFTFKIRILEKW
jgi:hypothetical protein